MAASWAASATAAAAPAAGPRTACHRCASAAGGVGADTLEVPEDLADVAPAVATPLGRLPHRELVLDGRADDLADRGPKEAAEAGRKLQGPPFLGLDGPRQLGDPDEEVVRYPQDPGKGCVAHGAGVVGLSEKVSDERHAVVVDLVRLIVHPGGAVALREDQRL